MSVVFVRLIVTLCAAFALFVSTDVRAQEPAGLYSAVTIITGTLAPERQRGFAECLKEVLVKVSGDPGLAGSPAAAELGRRAETFVKTYSLRDRMAGIPVHDEQGTRERPHFLEVEFLPAMIEAALRALGRTPWTGRPVITLLVGVDNGAKRFLLTRESALGVDHRDALADIAERLGLKVMLPSKAAPSVAPFDHVLPAEIEGQSEAIRQAFGGDVVLSGVLVWDEKAFHWNTRWVLVSEDGTEAWTSSTVSFDSAFRDGLVNTMAVLSRAGRQQ